MATTHRLLAILLLGSLAMATLSPPASAAAVAASCSAVTLDNSGVGTRIWYFGTGDTPGTACTTSTDQARQATSGNAASCPSNATCNLVLRCRESTTGATPPAPASTLTLKIYRGNDNFGHPEATGQIWMTNPTGATCTSEQSYTLWCTSDGTSTGAPTTGTFRIVLRAEKSSVPRYDVNTDAGTWGTYACNSVPGGEDPILLSGGYSWDTVRMSVSASATYTNGTRRQGIADLFTVLVIAPDNTTAVANLSMVESPAGIYSGRFDPGTPPMLGTWSVTASVWQPDMVDRAVANTRITITVNASQKFADQYALTQAMWAAANQSSLDSATRLTYTNALFNASMVYTWSLENATKAQEMADAAATQAAIAGVASQTTGGFAAANASRIASDLARNLTLASNLATTLAEIDATAAATQSATAGGFLAANASRIANDLARNLTAAADKAQLLSATAGGFLAANASRDASDLARNLSAAADKAELLAAINARAGEANASRIASDLARNLTEASNTASIIAEVDAKAAEIEAQASSLAAASAARDAYTNALVNLTSATQIAAESYTDTLLQQLLEDLASFRDHVDARLNATDAAIANLSLNASSRDDALGIHVDGDAGAQSYTGRATALNATILNGTHGAWGALLVTWDLGDHSTALGPVVYHAYEKPGDYHVIARAVDALGTTSVATATVNVTNSVPDAEISGPENVTQLYLVTYSGADSADEHDTIATYAWEIDAGDVDIPMIGVQHYNKGYGSGATFRTSFPTIGDHRLTLTVTNAHGGTNTTTLLVHVGSPVIPTPGAPNLPAPGNPNSNIASGVTHTLGFFEWLARFVTGR